MLFHSNGAFLIKNSVLFCTTSCYTARVKHDFVKFPCLCGKTRGKPYIFVLIRGNLTFLFWSHGMPEESHVPIFPQVKSNRHHVAQQTSPSFFEPFYLRLRSGAGQPKKGVRQLLKVCLSFSLRWLPQTLIPRCFVRKVPLSHIHSSFCCSHAAGWRCPVILQYPSVAWYLDKTLKSW